MNGRNAAAARRRWNRPALAAAAPVLLILLALPVLRPAEKAWPDGTPAPAPPAPTASIVEGVVFSVADGDTLTIRTRDGRKIRVRLYGIDAPEVAHKETPGQPHGDEARGALAARVRGREVSVEIVDEDDYGRAVGVVREGLDDINLAMVRAGHAWAYRKRLRPPYEAPYREAQRRARAERLGLWREPGAVPPWAFKGKLRATAGP